jgi:3-methyladenine DNA glycosylase AlkD
MREDIEQPLKEIMQWLEAEGSEKNRLGMQRFGIDATNAFGVSIPLMRKKAREYRCQHDLALHLLKSPVHEAKMMAALIADPKQLTASVMDKWVLHFDSWDVCDTTCMHLFVRSEFAYKKIIEWSRRPEEFVRRAGFALMAAYALRNKKKKAAHFAEMYALIKQFSEDERNFVKKAVNWGLRQIGKTNPDNHKAASALASLLAASDNKTARWIGKDAMREFQQPAIIARLQKNNVYD